MSEYNIDIEDWVHILEALTTNAHMWYDNMFTCNILSSRPMRADPRWTTTNENGEHCPESPPSGLG